MSGACNREANPDPWDHVIAYGLTIVLLLVLMAFPRLWYPRRLRPPLSARGVVTQVVVSTATGFALRAVVLPYFRRMEHKREEAEDELRRQLGRTPTDEELCAHLGICRTSRSAAG